MLVLLEYDVMLRTFKCIHDWGTKKIDMYLKDYKGQLWIFLSYIIIVLVDCCKPIDKMMSC